MNKPIALAAALAVSVASFSFAQERPQDRSSITTPAAQSGDKPAAQMASQQHDEKEFIKEAAGGNAFEIQLSQLVEQRSQDPQVKQVAQQIIKDHQHAQMQLKQVAQATGATTDDQLSPVQQAKLQEFQKKQGAELDRAYIFCNVGDHHKDVLVYSWEARNAQSQQLKEYCEQTLPHLREHMQHVDQVAMSMTGGNDAQTASERIPGSGAPTHTGTQSDRPSEKSNTPASTGNPGAPTPGTLPPSNSGTNGGTGAGK